MHYYVIYHSSQNYIGLKQIKLFDLLRAFIKCVGTP